VGIDLVHGTFVKNEAHTIGKMLDSVLPYVKNSYILVDDTTTDDTVEIAQSYGCLVKTYKFENFGKAQNILLKWMNGSADWFFDLAPDETISPEFGEMLWALLPKIHSTKIDLVLFPRMHWLDLEMTQKKEWNYPDWQQRLIRLDYPRIHCIRYVHELINGLREAIYHTGIDINHFNLYWRGQFGEKWLDIDALYKKLIQQQRVDNGVNIWPDKEETE
jgi:glycosyltransferase involved in cell wall biosynthesis